MHRHARKQIERLEDHANGLTAMPREFERSHAAELASENENGTGSGVIETGEQVEQRRFAGTGGAQKRQEFAGMHVERNAIHCSDGRAAQMVVARDVFRADRRRVCGEILRRCHHFFDLTLLLNHSAFWR